MFGSIICNKKELTKEEKERYQSTYCGLCRAIKKRYGQVERITLNYDMTFLAIFLNSLYDESDEVKGIRCPIHPLKMQNVFENKYIDYAAHMTILLSYYKCKDDWEDEKKPLQKGYGNYLEKHVRRIRMEYPRQESCVRENLVKLGRLEKSNSDNLDEVVNCSGKMFSEIFVYEEDFWSESLRQFGYEMGRFIYLMDAVLDYEYDKKKHNYNPLLLVEQKKEDLEGALMQAIGNATAIFEKLPIIQDAGIIRNILYGGVWQQYYAKLKRREEKNGN